jgi:hypothetical protein
MYLRANMRRDTQRFGIDRQSGGGGGRAQKKQGRKPARENTHASLPI